MEEKKEEKNNFVELSDKMVIDNGLYGQYVEEVLDQCVQKLYEDYQKTPTREVNIAITHIETALLWLDKREDVSYNEDNKSN